MRLYAGIGSRNTPPEVLAKMTKCAKFLNARGYTLRSGGAIGADSAFESGAGNNKEIFLPTGFIPLWTNIFTDHFHPSKGNIKKEFVRKLMNRNAMQILGVDGNSPVDFVVCYTSDGLASGGTGQAMRIAERFDIPIFNFYYDDCGNKIREFVGG